MSLQVWLPLNGNINNYGTSDLVFSLSTSNTTINSAGKIGQCYNNNSFTAGGLISNKTLLLGNKQSMCCWFKFSSLMSNSSLGGAMVGQHRYPSCTGMGLTLKYVSETTGYLSINTGTGSSRTYNTYCGSTLLSANTWYHGCFTYDGNIVKLYINGNLDGTHTVGTLSNPIDYVHVFNWSFSDSTGAGLHGNYKLNGNLNDVRVYDEVLSAKQIKEIAKGLVVHYPLSNPYNGLSNKYSSPYCDGYMSNAGGFTCTKLANERGYNYKRTYTGTGSNAWMSLCVPNYAFIIGKKYYYSVKIRCNKWTGDTLHLRASRSNNDWVTNMICVCSTALADGQWHEYYVYQTVNETYDRSGSTITSNPVLEFYTGGVATEGFVYDFDFDIKDVQVVESECYLPFIQGGLNSSAIVDTSGHSYNLGLTGNINIKNNSPRNNYYTQFLGSSGGYAALDTFNVSTNAFTISYWINVPASISSQHFLFGTFNNWTGNGIGIWRDTGSVDYSYLIKSDSESNYSSFTKPGLTANTWTFITLVYTGAQLLTYKNGVLIATVTYGSNGLISNPVLYLGNSKFNGTPTSETDEAAISDFRMYATALSIDDVKELYNAPISITNTGVLMTQGEIIEE